MTENDLRLLIEAVREKKVSRRAFIRHLASLGLSASVAAQLLLQSGIANGQPRPNGKTMARGGGGALRLLYWQAPTLLNPHFGIGAKDVDAARFFYEPLANWDSAGNLVPALAVEVPSLENGGVARDGLSVTWKLKRGVRWHDGAPFTADDCVFNWEYARDPETAAITIGWYQDINVVKRDDYTVRIEFRKPTPFWADAFIGGRGLQIPRHLFERYRGARSRDAPQNLRPVGTGPYRFADFMPGDAVRGRINPDYHEPGRPHFDTIEMKGGGDAASAARAVIQTGEFDFAWNLQVEDEILVRLEKGGRGKAVMTLGGDIEFIMLNQSDPWTETDGERSSPKSRHPVLSDPAVREALSLLVDRASIQKHIYGRTGVVTANFMNNPERFNSRNVPRGYDVAKANALLDAAGWLRGADGLRAKNGRKPKFLFQTSINAPRQKTQAIVKQACQKAGMEIELKTVVPSVYFSSDVGNPDTNSKFFADLQLYTQTRGSPDPGRNMEQFCSWELTSRENKWQGRNIARWRNDEYDRAFRAAEVELDPVKRAALLIRMNDLVCNSHAILPVVLRPRVSGISNRLRASFSAWDGDLWNLRDWRRDG
ncbi:MAG: peptide ABC transporter substrate-binding protein [Betaproteobacteria bacterium RIFCSPLOWO2_02_FULL_66_14]|nr:MAG: peptide ABC transporter substrate-binding protein [Betaproteobacteria bacterium RIFCSPLOWO2_02_FULL_66_14]